ncbi:ice-binding family protein, partial [Arthrobacter sp. AET 35A]|uniref:ice-binding family protein n=1 Tax=Arthrobacter sp. AET 35A TaxID=2292643 RepID=UPI001492450F
MSTSHSHRKNGNFANPQTRAVVGVVAATTAGFMVLLGALTGQPAAFAADAPLLSTAANYSVLAGTTVTNTGATTLNRRLGLSPGMSVTGAPVSAGEDIANPAAVQAKSDLDTAYNNAALEPSTASVAAELGGLTLVEGVYTNATGLGLNGALTLNGQGNPNAVFIFQAGSTLTTGSSSSVQFINGAQACNVYWQVGSSATLGSGSAFAGTILAQTSITVNSASTIDGRALARDGAVTLNNNVFTSSECITATVPPTTTPVPSPTTTTPVPSPTVTTPVPTPTVTTPTVTTPVPTPTVTTPVPTSTVTTPVPTPTLTTPVPSPTVTTPVPTPTLTTPVPTPTETTPVPT